MKNRPLLLSVLFLSAVTARAVIIAGGDGTGNTNAPSGDQGWSYVGRLSNVPSSVTYVGNQWFITANHIKVLDNPSSVLLNGSTYSIVSDSWTRITNSTGTGADLIMFRVFGNVGLASLTVSASSLSSGTGVTMIGNGLNRYPDLRTLSLPGPDETFYHIKSGTSNTAKRWGTNTIEGDGGMLDIGYGITESLFTDFDYVAGEAQGAIYDSGGGVFANNAGSWELAGIMLSISNLYTISGTNAVMLTGGNNSYGGSATYLADLSVYRDQINQVIPEPTTGILLAGIGIVFGVIKRIRYMYQ